MTLAATVDRFFQGRTVYFYSRSGRTNKVQTRAVGSVDQFGTATVTFNAIQGQILAVYAKVMDAPELPNPYSTPDVVAFKVQ